MSEFSRLYTQILEYRTQKEADMALACIQIKTHNIRVMITDDRQQRLLAFDEIQFTRNLSQEEQILQIQHFLPESGLSKFPVKQVQLIYEPRHFVLVPEPIWDEKNAHEYLLQTGDPDYDFRIMEQPFGEGHHLVFALPLVWQNWASQLFESSEMQWCTSLLPLINRGMESCKTGNSLLMASVENAYVFILAFRDGSLQFLNRFDFRTENDLLYFCLLAAETAGIQPEKDRFLLCGSLLPSSLGFEKLNRYFGATEFLSEKGILKEETGTAFLQHSVYFDFMVHLPISVS